MSEAILVTRDGPIATVVLNNPDRLNARTRAAWARLNDVMDGPSAAETDESYALCDSQDYREGLRAFLAKEKPAFRGR